MQKNFNKWIKLKENLHNSLSKPPYFKEGEVWWCSVGENIGHEVNGKSQLFSRPVFILRKLSSTVFIGIPLSTKLKEGSWYVTIIHKGKIEIANISQLRLFDYRRLSNKQGELNESDCREIKKHLSALLGL